MKYVCLLLVIMFVLVGQASFTQTKKTSYPVAETKLGKDKILQFYWTSKLGALLLIQPSPPIQGLTIKVDSVLFGTMRIKTIYYDFGNFALVVYDKEYEVSLSSNFNGKDHEYSLQTRFISHKDWDTQLADFRPIKEMYIKLSGAQDFDPSQQELDEICTRLSL